MDFDIQTIEFIFIFPLIGFTIWLTTYHFFARLPSARFKTLLHKYVLNEIEISKTKSNPISLKNAMGTYFGYLLVSATLLLGVVMSLLFGTAVKPNTLLGVMLHAAIINGLISIFYLFILSLNFLLGTAFFSEEHTYDFLVMKHNYFIEIDGFRMVAICVFLVDNAIKF